MRIHLIISCIHLKQHYEDTFGRKVSEPRLIVVDEVEKYVIEKLGRTKKDPKLGELIEVK